jgi:hypothetical protein
MDDKEIYEMDNGIVSSVLYVCVVCVHTRFL